MDDAGAVHDPPNVPIVAGVVFVVVVVAVAERDVGPSSCLLVFFSSDRTTATNETNGKIFLRRKDI